MKSKTLRMFLLGFLFGTIGLYGIAMLSLLFSQIEYVLNVLAGPGRSLSAFFFGTEATSFEVALLTLFNGLFYAFVFVILRNVFFKPSQPEDRSSL